MLADLILVAVGVLGLTFASAADIKSKEIPDWLSFSLLAAALGVRFLYSLHSGNWMYLLWGILGAAALFLIGCVLYYTKQWGGGDAKLIMALGAIFATRPFFVRGELPFLTSIAVNIIVVGSIYGLFWVFYLYVTNFKVATMEALRIMKKYRKRRIALLSAGVLLAVSAFFVQFPDLKMMLYLLAVVVVLYSFLVYFVKAVEAVGMFERLPIRKLAEGDWIAETVKVEGKVICSAKDNGISKEQILALKRAKVKDVLVKEGIPFVPSFLIAVVLSLLLDNIVLFFL